MHKGLKQIFTRYFISRLLPRFMQVQNKVESYLLFLGPNWKSLSRRWEPIWWSICACICVHWLGSCICFSWQKLSFVKSRNLRLALPVMHLPYSSLIFSLKGALKFCRQLSIYSFYQVKGQQKRLNCCFKCIFLVEYLFYYSLSETDKKLTFSLFYIEFCGLEHFDQYLWY